MSDRLFAYYLVTVSEAGDVLERGFSSPHDDLAQRPYSDDCPVVVCSNQAVRRVDSRAELDMPPCLNPDCGRSISYFACDRCDMCGEKVLPLGSVLVVP